jgi:murein DD-endopeptidase MepM/ murein hydrolase activator NlpD
MKVHKKKGILLVPPGGARVRTVGIPRKLIVVVIVVVALGFVGYFIPFNSFTIDVVKQNQERNLQDQNGKLVAMIRPLYRLRVTLSSELDRLDRKRLSILEKLGEKEGGRLHLHGKNRAYEASLGDLTTRVKLEEELFRGVAAAVAKHPCLLDSIPLIKPVGDKSVVSARFALELDPFTGTVKHHYGTDFIGVRGSPIVATASGTVARVDDGKTWGKRILVNHGFGYSTVYAHLGTVEVFTGKKVKRGDCIATMGISGVTSGPHLHYEVWRHGTPLDPEQMFFPDIDSVGVVALQ